MGCILLSAQLAGQPESLLHPAASCSILLGAQSHVSCIRCLVLNLLLLTSQSLAHLDLVCVAADGGNVALQCLLQAAVALLSNTDLQPARQPEGTTSAKRVRIHQLLIIIIMLPIKP
jgi:hypothetical protein